MRVLLIASCARLWLCVLISLLLGTQAFSQATSGPDLSGWWISIDETGPKQLWDRNLIVPMEELLIIDRQGNFENRMMGLWGVSRASCSEMGLCSDAPTVATGRLSLSKPARSQVPTLSINDHRPTRARIDTDSVDPMIRAIAISSTPSWSAVLDTEAGVLMLHRDTNQGIRTFFRIDPNRLRRLRSAFMATELSGFAHWRCWLAGATDASLPSPGLRPNAELAPNVADFLMITSYIQTLESNAGKQAISDVDSKLVSVVIEELMIERFANLVPVANVEDARRAFATAAYIRMVGLGQPEEPTKMLLQKTVPDFKKPDDVTDNQIAAFGLARAESSEGRRLFCKR